MTTIVNDCDPIAIIDSVCPALFEIAQAIDDTCEIFPGEEVVSTNDIDILRSGLQKMCENVYGYMSFVNNRLRYGGTLQGVDFFAL